MNSVRMVGVLSDWGEAEGNGKPEPKDLAPLTQCLLPKGEEPLESSDNKQSKKLHLLCRGSSVAESEKLEL